jgi:hypothetical protein
LESEKLSDGGEVQVFPDCPERTRSNIVWKLWRMECDALCEALQRRLRVLSKNSPERQNARTASDPKAVNAEVRKIIGPITFFDIMVINFTIAPKKIGPQPSDED